MIYDTTFRNLIVDSFDRGTTEHAAVGAQYTLLSQSVIVIYSGSMPTYEEFVADWDALYKFNRITVTNGGIDPVGTNILCSYGSTASNNDVYMTRVNNEFYMNTNITPYSPKYKDGTPGFAVLFPYSAAYTTSNGPDSSAFMILSVSDVQGNGIVKLSTMDTTIATTPPTLMSVEFEVNMGA